MLGRRQVLTVKHLAYMGKQVRKGLEQWVMVVMNLWCNITGS